MKERLERLCADKGVSGSEQEMHSLLRELLPEIGEITTLPGGSLIMTVSGEDDSYHMMLDAHVDRIGLTVTYIDDNGFIKAEPVGGIDLRTLPGSLVTVLSAKEEITGIICTMPPHIDNGEGELSRDKIWIDTGLPVEAVKEMVQLGDTILLKSKFQKLLNGKAAVSALDNRAGCAALIECAAMLQEHRPSCKVSFVFSSQEETNESGAKTAAFALMPDEAIAVDVGFGAQEGVPTEKSGKLGCGAIISIAPVLSKTITRKLISLCEKLEIHCDYEVDGGSTGTNGDGIAVTGRGIPTGVVSIPEKNMHTPAEIVSLQDIEAVAKLLYTYIMEGGIRNAR